MNSDHVAACQRDRGRVDGVFTRQRRRDAVVVITRESARLANGHVIRAGLFYEGLVVASRQGAPLSEPPSYGEASPALEHLVLYDDGSSEWLTLRNEKVRYVQATRAAQLVGQVTASLSADDDMDWFAAPVEAEALGLVDYHNVITEPMDLGTADGRVDIKVQVSFNSGSLGVCVRCCSLHAVEGIPRRSCPSLS